MRRTKRSLNRVRAQILFVEPRAYGHLLFTTSTTRVVYASPRVALRGLASY